MYHSDTIVILLHFTPTQFYNHVLHAATMKNERPCLDHTKHQTAWLAHYLYSEYYCHEQTTQYLAKIN